MVRRREKGRLRRGELLENFVKYNDTSVNCRHFIHLEYFPNKRYAMWKNMNYQSAKSIPVIRLKIWSL